MSDLPPAQAMGQGIFSITLPLPFRSPKSVNAYIIEGADGLTLIDCGVDNPEGYSALVDGFTELDLETGAVNSLIVSHLHPDHVGMAPRLVKEWGLQTIMHQRAAGLISRYNDTAGFAQRTRDLALRHGVPETARPAFVDVGERPQWMPFIDQPDRTVEEGELIPVGSGRYLEVLFTPGHEPAHICLRDSHSGALFAGDHILPRITPFVGYDELFPDVLGEFLDSLRKIEKLAISTTYPAHGSVVEQGSARAEQILLHHQRRLLGMVEVIGPIGATSWEVMEQVFRPHLTPGDQRLALRETIAHLEHLRLTERIRAAPDSDMVRYLP